MGGQGKAVRKEVDGQEKSGSHVRNREVRQLADRLRHHRGRTVGEQPPSVVGDGP